MKKEYIKPAIKLHEFKVQLCTVSDDLGGSVKDDDATGPALSKQHKMLIDDFDED